MDELQTDRLMLRPFQDADLDDLATLYRDPEVMQWLGNGVRSRDESKKSLDRMIDHWRHFGFGPWSLIYKKDRVFVGRCGVGYFHDLNDPELLYTLARPYWGQGLATEAARAAVAHVFRTQRIKRIVAYTLPSNIASRRVMEKVGMTFVGETRYNEFESVVYSLEGPGR